MAITLNHTIVPAHDKEASAKFFAKIFGLKYEGAVGHFAPVQVNDTLTLDFDNRDQFESHHYAFHVNDEDFNAIFDRVKAEGIAYGSGPSPKVRFKRCTLVARRASPVRFPVAAVMTAILARSTIFVWAGDVPGRRSTARLSMMCAMWVRVIR